MARPKRYETATERNRAYYHRHKPRIQEYKRRYYQENKLRVRLQKFGVSVEDYGRLLEAQQHGCALCGDPPENSRDGVLMVDHCHTTGKVRGLLCMHCNLGLGYFRDDPERMRRAARYIEEGP